MNRKFHFSKASRRSMNEYIQAKREGESRPAQAPFAPLVCAALTHVGKVRSSNQDALVMSEALHLYGVADGMGGHKGGETASSGCRDQVLSALEGKEPSLSNLREAIEQANAALFEQQKQDESLSGMGTTLSLTWFSADFVYIAHVGDSRVYCLRGGALQQMTDDHSLVAELVRKGMLTQEQAESHPMRNVITRAVGTEEGIDIDLAVEERHAGDIWLICSDGLHGLVSDGDMEGILESHAPDKAAKLLLDAALKAGGRDNISVVVLHDKEGAQ
nr:Stp1/IreP family PP2C-type Ser/Thr phosphatase [Clostridia bacterium]